MPKSWPSWWTLALVPRQPPHPDQGLSPAALDSGPTNLPLQWQPCPVSPLGKWVLGQGNPTVMSGFEERSVFTSREISANS